MLLIRGFRPRDLWSCSYWHYVLFSIFVYYQENIVAAAAVSIALAPTYTECFEAVFELSSCRLRFPVGRDMGLFPLP